MDFVMNCERTFNDRLVYSVITMPEIWSTIAEDGQNPDDFEPNCDSDCWLLMTEGSETIGLYNLHPHNSCTLEIHAHVIPEHRNRYSRDTGRAALKWIMDHSPDMYQKVIAQVPDIYPNVRKFCELNGLILEGTNRESYRKNGVLLDQYLLGITRKEIEAQYE